MTIAKRDKLAARRRIEARKAMRHWLPYHKWYLMLIREAEKHHDPVGDALNEYEQTRPFKDAVSRRLH